METLPFDPIILLLIKGIFYRQNNFLNILARDTDVVQMIITRLKAFKKSIQFQTGPGTRKKGEYVLARPVSFPLQTGVNINMMPFKMGDNNSIPTNLHQYLPMIDYCLNHMLGSEAGKIGYLTIDESFVTKGNTQRRPGLHVDVGGSSDFKGKGILNSAGRPPHWGGIKGGIFMANNVRDSCQYWPCQIKTLETIGKHGNIEHLRYYLGVPKPIPCSVMVWMTDRTPHESLPAMEDGLRQFFRLVTSEVSVWYEKHSTKNPLGIQPGSDTKIVSCNKFEV